MFLHTLRISASNVLIKAFLNIFVGISIGCTDIILVIFHSHKLILQKHTVISHYCMPLALSAMEKRHIYTTIVDLYTTLWAMLR